jgi:MFS family permease
MDIPKLLATVQHRIFRRRSQPESLEERNIRYFTIDTGWNGVVGAGTGTFLAVLMARLGASSFLIGALTSIPALISMIVSLPASAYIERQHNHVRATTLSRLLFRLAYVLVAFLPFLTYKYFSLLAVILWALQAVPMAIAVVAWTSVVGAIVPPRRRAEVNGFRWAMLSLVTAGCVAVFGKLLDAPWLPFPLNYQLVFFISGVASLIGMVYFDRIVMPVDYAPENPPQLPLGRRFRELLSPMLNSPAFINYLLATFLVRVGLSVPTALYSIFWVRNLQATDTLIGLRTTVGMVATVIGYFWFGKLATRRGHRGILLASSIGLGLYPVMTALAPNPYWLIPAAFLWGLFTGGINISFFEALFETTLPEKRPSFAALNAVFANFAVFIGPPIGSLLMGLVGIQGTFYIAGGMHIVGAILCWCMGVGLKRRYGGPAPRERAS